MSDPEESRCMIGSLPKARKGQELCFSKNTIGCAGGKRYCGFSKDLRPGFEFFLSYGNGKIEGERYKKDPGLVNQLLKEVQPYDAPGNFLIVKRWDLLRAEDEPSIVVFFATSDVLSGLFTLANYDEPSRYGVVAPMGAGCATIVQFPLIEAEQEHPKCVLGMFDPSARPHISAHELTFAVPYLRFKQMVANMDESFLITKTWDTMSQRINN
jgi:hypothetical protein